MTKQFIQMSALKVGDSIQADNRFDCIPEHSICEVMADSEGLYVTCADGNHYLEGQRADFTEACVGFYPDRVLGTYEDSLAELSETKPKVFGGIKSITYIAGSLDKGLTPLFGLNQLQAVQVKAYNPDGYLVTFTTPNPVQAGNIILWFESMWEGQEITIAVSQGET